MQTEFHVFRTLFRPLTDPGLFKERKKEEGKKKKLLRDLIWPNYRTYHKYLDKQACENSVYPA